MRLHHYGRRYDLVKAGCLTINARVRNDNMAEVMKQALEFAKKVDQLDDFDFEWQSWNYGQNFHCKLGTTEMLVECMLVEQFWNDYWNGVITKDDRFKPVVIRINLNKLPDGPSRYFQMLK